MNWRAAARKRRKDMELITLEHLPAVLEEYAQEVRAQYRRFLRDSDRPATGNLLNNIEYRVDVNGSVYSVTLTLEEYWKYVEYGTRPHWPPVSAIQKWIEVKPVIPRPDSKGRIPSPRQLAYLISRKIAERGTEGSHDLESAIREVNAQYRDKLIVALRQDCSGYIQKLLYEIKGGF